MVKIILLIMCTSIFLFCICKENELKAGRFNFTQLISQQSRYSMKEKAEKSYYPLIIPVLSKKKHFSVRKVKRSHGKERKRITRSIGSLKVSKIWKTQFEADPSPSPPSLVALVALDILAAIFTLNAIVALLFVSANA